MIKRWQSITAPPVFSVIPVGAQKKENERVANAGRVMSEILQIPDNIPADLLQKAECVIVLPSVLKFAIGIGSSYGVGEEERGAAGEVKQRKVARTTVRTGKCRHLKGLQPDDVSGC
jgi:hypothetical protein